MAGYTRQSVADIINGAEITAPPLNAEFNQLSSAFNAVSGHSHDGTTGNAPKINLATSVTGVLPAEAGGLGGKNNLTATARPTINNDVTQGYARGSLWSDTTDGRLFVCVSPVASAAVWRELVQIVGDNAILPDVSGQVDLGSVVDRFKDMFLSGNISAVGSAALGSNLNVSGLSTLSSVNVSGGTLNNTSIGASTPAAGTFTNLSTTGTTTVGTNLSVGGAASVGTNLTVAGAGSVTGDLTVVNISSSGLGTFSTVDINGGAIDATTIGASTPAAASFTTVSTSGQATLATVNVDGGTIDGTAIGASVPSSGRFTTVNASGGVTGNLTGNVTGNVTGNLTGNVTGNVSGNVTGDITSGNTSSFNNVVINGTLNMNAGTSATITNLTSPVNVSDAATKGYVDTSLANLVDAAPGTLDTLNELAAALGDDPNFSTTITNSIATKLPLAGGTMSGNISMSGNRVTNVSTPSAAGDVANKSYVDTQDALQVSRSGDSMSGTLDMGGNKVTNVASPTANNDAANKVYVDAILGSATAASTSATAAALSESNAATSETNAAASEASAASIYDQFDDRYLGSKAVDPTVDNDGDPLATGALYYNTSTSAIKVYDGSTWVAAYVSGSDFIDRFGGTMVGTLGFADTVAASFGDAGDLQIVHDGLNSYIKDQGTGNLILSGASDIRLESPIGESMAVFTADAGVTLYHDNSAKLSTNSTGISVTGNIAVSGTVDGRDVAADGSKLDGIEANATGDQTAAEILTAIKTVDGSGSGLDADTLDGKDSSYFSTLSENDIRTGGSLRFDDNVQLAFGTSTDFQLYHNGSDSYIRDTGTGNLLIQGSNIFIQDDSGTTFAAFIDTGTGGSVSLRHQGNQKLLTSTEGVTITGTVVADGVSLGDNEKITVGNSNDLEISHDGSNSYIKDVGTGNLRIDATNLDLRNAVGTETYATFVSDGAVTLFYDNSAKIATTSTGVDVTGSVVSDGLTVGAVTYPSTDGSVGQMLTTNGSGTVSFQDVPQGYANADVDSHLNTSTATIGQNLRWNGSDYDWQNPLQTNGITEIKVVSALPATPNPTTLYFVI